jgi:hypothetical protein
MLIKCWTEDAVELNGEFYSAPYPFKMEWRDIRLGKSRGTRAVPVKSTETAVCGK